MFCSLRNDDANPHLLGCRGGLLLRSEGSPEPPTPRANSAAGEGWRVWPHVWCGRGRREQGWDRAGRPSLLQWLEPCPPRRRVDGLTPPPTPPHPPVPHPTPTAKSATRRGRGAFGTVVSL